MGGGLLGAKDQLRLCQERGTMIYYEIYEELRGELKGTGGLKPPKFPLDAATA